MFVKYRRQCELFSFGENETNETEKGTDSMTLLKQIIKPSSHMSQAIKQSEKIKRGRRYEDNVLSDLSVNL